MDLKALEFTLDILKNVRVKELKENPECWMEQLEKTNKVMEEIIDKSISDDEYEGLTGKCRWVMANRRK